MVVHQQQAESAHVGRCRDLAGIGQSGCVDETRRAETKLLGPHVHRPGEGVFAAIEKFADRRGNIVGTLDRQRPDGGVDGDLRRPPAVATYWAAAPPRRR